jgi:hypothetical protein
MDKLNVGNTPLVERLVRNRDVEADAEGAELPGEKIYIVEGVAGKLF